MLSNLKEKWPVLFFLIFFLIFFRKVFLQGLFPIPGDFLVTFFFPFSSGGFSGYSEWTTRKGLVADDAIKQQYPWKVLSGRQWSRGQVPLWNPYAFSGYPQAANWQTGAFYPLNFLFAVIDPKAAWLILIMVQMILEYSFMYLFLRSLKINRSGAVFGSLVFIGMSFELLWYEQMIMGHTTLWLPLILLSIQKISEGNIKWYFGGILGIALSLLAGYAQTSLFVLLIAFGFAMMKVISQKTIGEKKKLAIKLFLMGIIGLGLAAVQIIPTLEIYSYSNREGGNSAKLFSDFLVTPRHLLTLISPDFFGNVATNNFWGDQYQDFNLFFGITALIIIIAAVKKKLYSKEIKWFLVIGILGLLFSIPGFGTLPFLLHIPILNTGAPARFLFIFQFCMAVVAGGSLSFLVDRKTEKVSLKPLLVFVLILTITIGSVAIIAKSAKDPLIIQNFHVTLRNLYLPAVVLLVASLAIICIVKKRAAAVASLVIICLLSLEFLYLANKYLPFSKPEFVFPSHPVFTFLKDQSRSNRFWGEGNASVGSNIPTNYEVFSPEGYDSLFIKRYGELVGAAKNGTIPADIPRSDVNIDPGARYKEKLLDLLSVKYLLDKNDNPKSTFEPEDWKFPPKRYKLVWQDGKFKAYENKFALPRMYLANKLLVKRNDQTIIDALLKSQEGEKIAVTEEPVVVKGVNNSGTVKLTLYSPARVIGDVVASNDSFLVLTDNYYPGWKATVDHKETKIYRTNYTFRGIVVPKGKHTVEFVYDPLSIKIGAVISLISITFMGLSYFIFRKLGQIVKPT